MSAGEAARIFIFFKQKSETIAVLYLLYNQTRRAAGTKPLARKNRNVHLVAGTEPIATSLFPWSQVLWYLVAGTEPIATLLSPWSQVL